MSNLCGKNTFESILLDLGLYAQDLGTLDAVNGFLVDTYGYSLEQLLNETDDPELLEDLKYILDTEYKLNYSNLLNKQLKEVSTANNINTMFRAPDILPLFHTMQVAKNYFEQTINEKLVVASLLGIGDRYVSSDIELSNNIKTLKNDLFNTVRTYLKENSVDLYDKDGKFLKESYDVYQETLHKLEEKLGNYPKIKSYSGNEVPILKVNIRSTESQELLNAYNAAIFLVNFDNVIEHYFNSIIKIDYDAFNLFQDGPTNSNKYSLKVKGIETVYWKGDSHDSESVEKGETKLSQLLISSVKELDKEGNFTGSYLETKDFYSFAALLKDFEIVHYNTLKDTNNYPGWVPFNEDSQKALDWYLTAISDFHSDKRSNLESPLKKIFGTAFEHKLEFVKSLQSYFKEHKINEKEKVSEGSLKTLFTQIINNSVGATYLIYNASKKRLEEKEMHKHKANEVALQNAIYANISKHSEIFNDKIDAKKINDILKDLPTKLIQKGNLNVSDNSIADITSFLKYKLGIGLTYDNTIKMLFELSKKNNLTKDEFKAHLTLLSTTINTAIPDVVENQKVASDAFADAESESATIADVIGLPIVREVIHRHLDSYIMKPLMNIETLSGEKIPVFKTATLTYNDVSLFRSHEKHFANKSYKNLFLTGSEPVLLGTGTKLEVIRDDENKSAFKWSVAENFTGTLVYDFYKAIGNATTELAKTGTAGGFSVTIGNYADKNTGLTKIINHQAKAFPNAKTTILKDSIDNVLKLVQTQSYNYYADLFTNIFEQYNLLFKLSGKSESLNLNFKGNTSAFNKNVDIISAYLLQGTFKADLQQAFHNPDLVNKDSLKFIEELHYSTYNHDKVKVFALNQLLIDYFRIFDSNKLFAEFVAHQEQSLIAKHGDYFGHSNRVDFQETTGKKGQGAKQFADYIGLDYKDYQGKFESVEEKTKTTEHLLVANNELNPFVKKWMWVNALFRNEYLYMSGKGEYMHPHKDKTLNYRAGSISSTIINNKPVYTFKSNPKTTFETMYPELDKEMSGRLITMAKRNVVFTATIELPARKTQFGVPENINLATIEDHTAQVYTPGGETKNQEVHDGSSMINYLYSRMVDASYPGKGYKGTKKQFGTLVSEFGASVKKDAETVVTNDKIRNSQNSTISLKNKQQQMLSSHELGNLTIPLTDVKVKNKYFNKDGKLYSINSFKVDNGFITIYVSLKDSQNNFVKDTFFKTPAKTLFDIWTAFGAEYSMNEKQDYTEGSNELLYDLVTSYNENGNYILKNKMIHILSNKSAIKSGATNLNKSNMWVSDGSAKLMYSTFEHRHMGPQLDANHDADGSEIKEITQVISALAQNLTTSGIATDVYKDLATIIEKASKPYRHILFSKDDKSDIFDYVSKKFFDSITKSQNVSLAKTIMESFPAHIQIPYSNQNFFQLFVKDIISRMNNELITRYYSGIGAVLNPSHGMIQVYEDLNGNVFTQSDIVKEALKNYIPEYQKDIIGNVILDNTNKPLEVIKSNEQIIQEHVAKQFPHTNILLNEVQPGETVSFTINGISQTKSLHTIEDYYFFKANGPYFNLQKVNNVPRDLKPSEINYTTENSKYIPISGQIVWAHPGIGKTFLHEQGNTNIIDFDSVYKPRINIELNIPEGYEARKQWRAENKEAWLAKIKQLWIEAKQDAKAQGKMLFASDLVLLNEFANDFDRVINIPTDVFIERSKQRNEFDVDNKLKWKTDIDTALQKVDPLKVITTNHYLSEILPQFTKTHIFDSDSVRLKFIATNFEKGKKISDIDKQTLLSFMSKFNIASTDFKTLNKYLNAWTQRNLELLDKKIVMKSVSELNGDFSALFGDDSLINDNLGDVLHNYTIANTNPVFNYKFSPAELILPNINKSAFNTGTDSIASIKRQGVDYFKNKLERQLTSSDKSANMQILLGNGERSVYVKFTDHLPTQTNDISFHKDVEFVTSEGEDGNTETVKKTIYTRMGKDGEKLYTLPENATVVLEEGKEVIYIKGYSLKPFVETNKSKKEITTYYNQIDHKLGATMSDFINSFGGQISMIVPLMNNKATTQKEKEGKLVPSNINNIVVNTFKNFTGFINTYNDVIDSSWLERNLSEITTQLASKTYASWEKSQEFVAARIPSQSMQSFMEMKNIGYFNTDSNDAFVSVWQIFLQGSDFDVDKAYIIGYGFDKHSQYDAWTSAFNYSNKSELDALENLPIPTGFGAIETLTGTDLSSEFQHFSNYWNQNQGAVASNIYSPEIVLELANAFRKINNANIKTNKLDAKGEKIIDDKGNEVLVDAITFKFNPNDKAKQAFIDIISKHNRSVNALKSRHALKNSVVSKIKSVISAPSNQLLANTPVDVEPWHDATDIALNTNKTTSQIEEFEGNWTRKEVEADTTRIYLFGDNTDDRINTHHIPTSTQAVIRGLPNAIGIDTKKNRGLTNASYFTDADFDVFKLQVDEAIQAALSSGKTIVLPKDGIGTGKANLQQKAPKLFKYLVSELNKLKTTVKQSENKTKPLSSWDMFSMFKQQRDAAIGKDDVGIAANGLKVFFALSSYYNNIYTNTQTPLQGDQLRKAGHTFIKKLYLPSDTIRGQWNTINISTISDVNINRNQVADLMDAFGTELYIPKVHAAIAQSSFTSAATDNAKELLMAKLNASVELASMHLYMLSLGITPTQIAIFMNSYVANLVVAQLESNMFESNESVIISELLHNLSKSAAVKAQYSQELETFATIYAGAQEFKLLAKLLGVNQKTSANIIELHNYLSTFNTIVFTRENSIFSKDLWQLKSWNQWSDKTPEERIKMRSDVADKIIKNNSTLTEGDKNHVLEILDEVSSINYNGKVTSVLGGNFDFRMYMDEEFGKDYKEATQKYYNLIKNTINIFDVIDQVPHFKAMIGGVSISHNILLKSSKKYGFVFNTAIDLTRNEASVIQGENLEGMKNQFGNKSLPVKFGEREIRRAMLAYDKFVVGRWFNATDSTNDKLTQYRSARKPNMITFKVSTLLELAGLENIVLYKGEGARSITKLNSSGGLNSGYEIVSKDNDMVVDLMTDQGIANFKVLMENVIFEILKKDEFKKKNNFIDSLRLQSMKNSFGILGNQIVSSFNLSQLNTPVNAEKFQNLVSDFNSLDTTVPLLKNDKGDSMYWRDLFYVYNLVVNNEAYGDKRLTPLFEDYIKERNSLGYDYLLFSSKIDSGEVDIFKLPDEYKESKNTWITAEQAQINDLLFYLFHSKGRLNVRDEINAGKVKPLQIVNPDFVVNTSLVPISQTMDKINNTSRLLTWIKSNALVITFKCD